MGFSEVRTIASTREDGARIGFRVGLPSWTAVAAQVVGVGWDAEMADDRITTESVAVGAEETDPIVLRESETRRLVFKAMLVDKPEAPVRG